MLSYYVLQKQQKGKELDVKKPAFKKDNLPSDYLVCYIRKPVKFSSMFHSTALKMT